MAIAAVYTSASPEQLCQPRALHVRSDDLLLDAEDSGRFRIDRNLHPVNESLAIGLHARKELIGKRLIHEKEMVVAMCEHDRFPILLCAGLEVSQEGLESRGAADRIRGQVVRA